MRGRRRRRRPGRAGDRHRQGGRRRRSAGHPGPDPAGRRADPPGVPGRASCAGPTCRAPTPPTTPPWSRPPAAGSCSSTAPPDNLKVTTPLDLVVAAALAAVVPVVTPRVGLGFDIHPFSDDPGRPLVLAGVDLEGRGLAGHSDADAVAHADLPTPCSARPGSATSAPTFPTTTRPTPGPTASGCWREVVQTGGGPVGGRQRGRDGRDRGAQAGAAPGRTWSDAWPTSSGHR